VQPEAADDPPVRLSFRTGRQARWGTCRFSTCSANRGRTASVLGQSTVYAVSRQKTQVVPPCCREPFSASGAAPGIQTHAVEQNQDHSKSRRYKKGSECAMQLNGDESEAEAHGNTSHKQKKKPISDSLVLSPVFFVPLPHIIRRKSLRVIFHGRASLNVTVRPARPVAPAYPDTSAPKAQARPPADSVSRGPAPIFPRFFR